MILQSTQLSPRQKAAIEKIAGRKLQNPENIVVSGGTPQVASLDDRQRAAQRMRYQLYLLDPSERRMSIEEYASVLLEKSEGTA